MGRTQLSMFAPENTERIQRQEETPIFVIIGNPPYNVGQVSENDNNKTVFNINWAHVRQGAWSELSGGA